MRPTVTRVTPPYTPETPDLWLLAVSVHLFNISRRWWLWPWRNRLHAWGTAASACARDVAQMRRTVDELVDEAREQAGLAERQARAARDAAVIEMNRVVWNFSQRN